MDVSIEIPGMRGHFEILDEKQFLLTLVPTTLIAESSEDGRVVGYAYFQIMKNLVYVRHVVTAPAARRTGVARALLAEIVAQGHAAGCSAWAGASWATPTRLSRDTRSCSLVCNLRRSR